MGTRPEAVVFDLGRVLVDWDPRHLYRALIEDETEMEQFLADVWTMEWNERMDAGLPFADGVAELAARHPDQRELIEAFHHRWPETLGGAIDGTVAVLDELRANRVPVYALSNWSAETFPFARERYEFLSWFDGVLISGEVGVTKPHPRIFEELCRRFDLDPSATLFVDDSPANVESAARLGFHVHRFETPDRLRSLLARHRLLEVTPHG